MNTGAESRRVVQEAGLRPRYIAFDNQPVTNWFNILTHADHQQAVGAVIAVAQAEYPAEQAWLDAAKAGILTGVAGIDIATGVAWNGTSDPATLEKIIGKRSTLLPIHFLDVGAQKARAVVRIELPNGEERHWVPHRQ